MLKSRRSSTKKWQKSTATTSKVAAAAQQRHPRRRRRRVPADRIVGKLYFDGTRRQKYMPPPRSPLRMTHASARKRRFRAEQQEQLFLRVLVDIGKQREGLAELTHLQLVLVFARFGDGDFVEFVVEEIEIGVAVADALRPAVLDILVQRFGAGANQRVEGDRDDGARQDDVPAIGRQQAERHPEAGENEGEFADLREAPATVRPMPMG